MPKAAVFATAPVAAVKSALPSVQELEKDSALVLYAAPADHDHYLSIDDVDLRTLPRTRQLLAFLKAIRKERFDAIYVLWDGRPPFFLTKKLPWVAKAFHIYIINEYGGVFRLSPKKYIRHIGHRILFGPLRFLGALLSLLGIIRFRPSPLPEGEHEYRIIAPGSPAKVTPVVQRMMARHPSFRTMVFVEESWLEFIKNELEGADIRSLDDEPLGKLLDRNASRITVLWNGERGHSATKLTPLLVPLRVSIANENGDTFEPNIPKILAHCWWRLHHKLRLARQGGARLPSFVRILAAIYALTVGVVFRTVYLLLWQIQIELRRLIRGRRRIST